MAEPELRCVPVPARDTLPLRESVLRPTAYPDELVFPGDDDAETLHVAVMRGDEQLAIASIYHEARTSDAAGGAVLAPDHEAETAWRLRGMATAPHARRRGAGRLALEAVTGHALEHGATLLWCNARLGAVAFYEAAGWRVLGAEFDIPAIGPHVVMERHPRRPTARR